nr:MAG TPA: portal protein [Caudoviricetes sp.]
MGFSIKRLFKSRETPETERVASVEITDQQVQEAVTEVCLRELAFWTCVGKIANALTKCEFRTFYEGTEIFGDEYYLWNYEPNRNQNKAEFLSKAMEKLFRENELLIVESYDGQLLVADSFEVTRNTLYGDTYSNVLVDDYQFSRTFRSTDVLHWKLNNKNVNKIIQGLYGSYSKLIDYTAKSYLKSRGSRGILNISAMAQSDKLFEDKLKKLMNEYFKSFFSSSNAVLPLFEGYKYEDLGSKTYSEGTSRDIKNQYDDIFDFTARGFSMPPSLAKGDVQDTSKAVEEMLTFCLDPLTQTLQQEINRKRIGRSGVQKGTRLQINTMRVKHIDMFDIATPADKLISSGIYTVNMILRAVEEPLVAEEWADQHFITKNYSIIQEILEEQSRKGGGENGETA